MPEIRFEDKHMSTEKLVYSLRQVMRAEQEEKGARERYAGYEWGDRGFHLAE